MAKLKVFAAPQGFYETIVAAPSQKAALDAWGTHQDLFAGGMAKVTDDPAAIKAALARPGEVLSRPAGSSEAFKPSGQKAAPKVPKAPKKPKLAQPKGMAQAPASRISETPRAPAKTEAAPKPKPKPDRRPLAEAEKALKAAEAARSKALAGMERERAALDRKIAQAERRLDAELAKLEKARDRAQAAYLKAGGG